MNYKHTQTGWVVLGVCAGLIVLFQFLPTGAAPREIIASVLLVLILFILGLMGTLTVEVDDAAIRLRFGVGLVRKTFALADAASCRLARNQWTWGWGIRRIPGGWLYNVSGLSAVEVTMKNGKLFRIGTDDPRALCDTIQARLRKIA